MLNSDKISNIRLSQMHVAATMRKRNQIVVSDHKKLTSLFSSDHLYRYQCFGLKKHGNFTAERVKSHSRTPDGPNEFENVSYVQVNFIKFFHEDFGKKLKSFLQKFASSRVNA